MKSGEIEAYLPGSYEDENVMKDSSAKLLSLPFSFVLAFLWLVSSCLSLFCVYFVLLWPSLYSLYSCSFFFWFLWICALKTKAKLGYVGFFSGFSSLVSVSFAFCFFRSLILGFLLSFIEIPQPLPLTSPAFAGLLFSTNEIVGERRGPRLDRIRCRFSACWIGMEKTNTAVPPATATFRQQWTFSFWPLIFGILTVGSQLIKNSFQFFDLD